jgi:hypothetical protein
VQRNDQLLHAVHRGFVARGQQDGAVVLGRDGRAGQFDRTGIRPEQGGDRGVEGQGDRGQLRRREGAPSALGLVDGLAAPRLAQVLAQLLA